MKDAVRIAAVAVCVVATGLVTSAQRRDMGGVGITVFEDVNYRGDNATFVRDVPSLSSRDFKNQISSLRVGPGEFWEVCERSDYRGRCQIFSNAEPDLRRSGWNDRIASMRRLSGNGGSGGGFGGGAVTGGSGGGFGGGGGGAVGRLELFDDRNFEGKSSALTRDSPRLGSMSGKADSLRLSGRWEICDKEDFRGQCRVVSDNVSDLNRIGWKNRVRSARPR